MKKLSARLVPRILAKFYGVFGWLFPNSAWRRFRKTFHFQCRYVTTGKSAFVIGDNNRIISSWMNRRWLFNSNNGEGVARVEKVPDVGFMEYEINYIDWPSWKMTGVIYSNLLNKLEVKILENKKFVRVSVLKSLWTKRKRRVLYYDVQDYPPYDRDMPPSDFHLFLKLKCLR